MAAAMGGRSPLDILASDRPAAPGALDCGRIDAQLAGQFPGRR
jgi:hypothetical protein